MLFRFGAPEGLGGKEVFATITVTSNSLLSRLSPSTSRLPFSINPLLAPTQAVASSTSLDEANEALHRLGIKSELDLERERLIQKQGGKVRFVHTASVNVSTLRALLNLGVKIHKRVRRFVKISDTTERVNFSIPVIIKAMHLIFARFAA